MSELDLENRRLCPDGACIGVIGPDGTCRVCGRVDDAGPIEPADAAVRFCQRLEILLGQGIGGGRLFRDAEMLEKSPAGKMRGLPPRLADAEIARRLAEVHRHKLPVHIGDMQQRDIAERLEREQFGLRQPLLCQRAHPAVRSPLLPAGRARGRR